MSPLNDSCKQAVVLATRVNTYMIRDEKSSRELIQVVQPHRKINKTKKDVKTFIRLYIVKVIISAKKWI